MGENLIIKQYPNTYKIIYNIIRNFKRHYRKRPLRIEVLKLIYLIDVEYYKKYGKKYSELNYIYYNFGPWDRNFHIILDYMKETEISELASQATNGKEFYLYTITSKRPRHETRLDPTAAKALENLLFIYKHAELSQMLQVVYNEEPMASTKKGDLIDMTKLTLKARDKRKKYRQKRKNQLAKVATLQNDMLEDDLKLFNIFKPLRDRANSTL
ncbi:MAG: DUF4065 domain-containing protein [Proteobacteria bacterium]|nr:DUF4065 domain-containing protein [Pseudomonadota bacterium]